MPVFDDSNMITGTLARSTYGFSGTRIESLGASEYTVVGLTADISGSVSRFRQEIEDCVREIVRACRHSPRADNLLLRFTVFDDDVDEVHGFKPLANCDPTGYDGTIRAGGTTALYDASVNAVEAVTRYSQDLTDNDFDCNGIVFVITDGHDNASTLTARSLRESLACAVTAEAMESMVSVLIGVNVHDRTLSMYLARLRKDAGFDQYVELENADESTLSKLAAFVSRSISAQSSALGSGAAAGSLTF